MRGLRRILRHFERMPRGYMADGRMIGLATAMAIESSRNPRGDGLPDPQVAVPKQRKAAQVR